MACCDDQYDFHPEIHPLDFNEAIPCLVNSQLHIHLQYGAGNASSNSLKYSEFHRRLPTGNNWQHPLLKEP